MNDSATLLSHFAPAVQGLTFLGIVAGVAKGFEWGDDGLSKEGRVRLSKWLKNVPGDKQIDAWARAFPNLIDRVFGSRPLSWKFMLRSCVASLIAVGCVTFIFTLFTHHSLSNLFEIDNPNEIPIVVFMSLVTNCVPDYLSLLISRFIVRQMLRHNAPASVFVLLLVDTVLTTIIALVSVFTAMMLTLYSVVEGSVYGGLRDFTQLSVQPNTIPLIGLLNPRHFAEDPMFAIFFLASFFTSVWVWLYVLASVAIRVLHKGRFIWVKIVPALSIEDKPMQAIGRVAGLMAGCGYLILLGGIWLYHHL